MEGKIYALLVGIINYSDSISLSDEGTVFPALNGCINDVVRVRAYLEKNYKGNQRHIKELFDKDATRQNICDAFINHLGRAREGDSVLFYFSGHGTQEHADSCFINETDHKLECLVCYYDESTTGNFLLADKEIRYLIKKISQHKPHISIVIDSCHSGDATRNKEILKVNFPRPVEKKSRGGYIFPKRNWKDFIFHNEISPGLIRQKGLSKILPEGKHIAFSAAESDESAYEINNEGIFTKHFIDCLSAVRGYITNQSLYDRITQYMRYAYVQTPRIYVPAGAREMLQTSFLNTHPHVEERDALVMFNQNQGWILNRGEINGVHEGLGPLELFDQKDNSKRVHARIKSIEIDHTLLELDVDANTARIYHIDLDYLARQPINVYPALDNAIPKDAAALMNQVNTIPSTMVNTKTSIEKAHYILQHLEGTYFITRADNQFRPISSVVSIASCNEIARQLRQLSSWNFIFDLEKKTKVNSIPHHYLLIEYSLNGSNYIELDHRNANAQIIIQNWDILEGRYVSNLRVRLTNKSGRSLYVAVLYLDVNFAVDTFLVEPSPYFLDKDACIYFGGEPNHDMRVVFYQPARCYNSPGYTERFKIMASTERFEVYPLKLEALAGPPLPGEKTVRELDELRDSPVKPALLKGWFIRNVDLVSKNPSFNYVEMNDLRQMLNDQVTSHLARKLFYVIDNKYPFGGEYILRSEVTLTNFQRLQSSFKRMASPLVPNSSVRKEAGNFYREIVRRFPEKPAIVCLGDSWFHHPDAYGIADHLSKIYAVRRVASKRPMLLDYLNDAGGEEEFFLDVLRVEKPAFFMVSGGGNELFGPYFKGFLTDKPYEKGLRGCTDGSKFLSETFVLQLTLLISVYEKLFELLKAEFPKMRVIVHGYDYPVQIYGRDTTNLTRCMIEKGIRDAADCKTIINYIIDAFNTKLKQAATRYPGTVAYLDLRKTISAHENKTGLWHNETQPGIYGVELIGLKFIRLVETLKRASVASAI